MLHDPFRTFIVKVYDLATRRLLVECHDQNGTQESAFLAWSTSYPPAHYRIVITAA